MEERRGKASHIFWIYFIKYKTDMNGKQIIKLLQAQGFQLLRINGSHHILGNGMRKVTVPVHGTSDVKVGTLASIEKQSGVKLK